MNQLEYFTRHSKYVPTKVSKKVSNFWETKPELVNSPKCPSTFYYNSTAGVLEGEQEACRPRPADQRRSWRTGARNKFSWQSDQYCSRYQQNWFQSLFCELVQAFRCPAGTALSRCVSRWNALLKSLKSILSPPDARGPTMCVHRLFRGTSITLLEDHRSRMCFRMDLLE